MHLTLHLTGRCNLRCRYCYDGAHQGGDMSFETVRAALTLAMDSAEAKLSEDGLGVGFFGGEPLLRRELIAETVRHCRELTARTGQRFHLKLTTNGLLLDEEFLTGADTRDVFVALSHDGVQAAHDANRVDANGNGSFAALDRVVSLLLRHKPYAPVMLVVTPETVGHYAESVQSLQRRGFRYLICTLNYGAEWSPRALGELHRQYRRLTDWYYRATLAEEKFYFSPIDVKIASHVRPESCRAERCELGRKQVSVAPNGRLYPCVQFVGDGTGDAYCIGDVRTGFDEAARRRLYVTNEGEKGVCAECAIRERCNHYCGCLNRQATGRLDVVSPALCAHERMVLPLADQVATRLFRKKNALFLQKQYSDLYPLLSLLEDTAGSPEGATDTSPRRSPG